MGKPTGFIEIQRKKHADARRSPSGCSDWREVYLPYPRAGAAATRARAAWTAAFRSAISGCPLGNLIPTGTTWSTATAGTTALDRLHATNNFPEFTGRVCPAPCEGVVRARHQRRRRSRSRTIEVSIIDRAFDEGWVVPQPPAARTGKKVAVVGSGPAGLAAAAQLNRAGHTVTVFERADRIGGLLRYGIPDFKLEKRVLDRRLELMEEEGVVFRAERQRRRRRRRSKSCAREFDAIVLAGGATRPRDLPVPGRELKGIHFAMDFLTLQNRAQRGRHDRRTTSSSRADGKHVIIIGGGDTGADCLGTAHRQGARSRAPARAAAAAAGRRAPTTTRGRCGRTSSASRRRTKKAASGSTRSSTQQFAGDDERQRHDAARGAGRDGAASDGRIEFVPVAGSEFELKADLVLLAMGFVGPETQRHARASSA